ncbi:lysophospholipid acyltransferase family protein [Novosphingobium album (ex Liu et al. 2023)]|uniref:Lysophospholipid acyltransferase family protein n=1 Tax=Novosphingobium album (ex Liu et al. 2023) TaxID=3031130 RepID=A0ABT5WRD1_9SPHN|nr:lysophospholipid acyltransferase family protein [Novosphingobium album (ex Liu et al. 2023)]MDE8652599.1 lysophospholipid acyltransferase family protein [Novosphingobium album (ex Liu et al. 2023)]
MTATGTVAAPGLIAAWRWPLVALRLVALLLTLGLCVTLYYLCQPFTRRNSAPRLFLGAVAVLAGVRMTIRGERPGGSAFLLANHVSWLDIPALAGATGSVFIAHDGLAAIGPLRWLCSLNETVFVARHDRASVAAQVGQVRAAIRDHGALTLFPEGTTSDGTGQLAFKSSLLSALVPVPEGVAIRPVWLDYGPETADIAWVGEEPGLDNFLRILARLAPIQLTVHLLAPLAGEALASRKTIAAAAQAAIAQAMADQRRGQRVTL